MSENNRSITQLEDRLAEALNLWNVPGAVVGLIKDGELISSRGYGVREAGTDLPVNADTNFAIGSNTKAFVAASLGMLVEEGKLDWEDKVIKYLPDFAVYDPWVTAEVTVRDILSHRIGVADVERFLYNSTYSNTEVIRRLRFVQPAVPFRSDFCYSNISYMTAGEILRVISGQNWETFVQERIFTPLGMKRSTTNFLDVQKLDNIALPHVNKYSGPLSMRARILDPVEPVPWFDFGSQAAGSITSNVADMSRWIGMFLGKGTWQGKKILSPETAAMLTKPSNLIHVLSGTMVVLQALQAEIDFWSYGLGWFIFNYKNRKLVFHSGQVQGMISLTGFIPQENLGFVILTNINLSMIQMLACLTICDHFLGGSQRDWSGDCYKLVKQLRKDEEDAVGQLLASRKNEISPSLPLSAYLGTYDHEYFGEHTVTLEDGHLVLRFPPSLAGDLEHWQADEFLIHWRDDPFEGDFLTFSIDASRVNGFNIKNEGFFKKITGGF